MNTEYSTTEQNCTILRFYDWHLNEDTKMSYFDAPHPATYPFTWCVLVVLSGNSGLGGKHRGAMTSGTNSTSLFGLASFYNKTSSHVQFHGYNEQNSWDFN